MKEFSRFLSILTVEKRKKEVRIEPREKRLREFVEEIVMSYHFLLDLALILLGTKVLGLIAQKFQMPQVVGALIAGLLLGPAGLNLLSETELMQQISELGVIVLMFSAGMGTDINELKHSGKAGFMVALLGVIVPFLMGTGLAWGAPIRNVVCEFMLQLLTLSPSPSPPSSGRNKSHLRNIPGGSGF